MSPPPEVFGGGGQASQSGDAVLLGSDLKIPTAFYDQGGGGMQKVSYDSGQDFLDALMSTDGLYRCTLAIGELEMSFCIFSDETARRNQRLPTYGLGFNAMSGDYFGICATRILSDVEIRVYLTPSGNQEISASSLNSGAHMEAYLL